MQANNAMDQSVPTRQKEFIYLDSSDTLVLDAMIQNGETINTMASILFHSKYMTGIVNNARYYAQPRDCSSVGYSAEHEYSPANLYAYFVQIRNTVRAYVAEKAR